MEIFNNKLNRFHRTVISLTIWMRAERNIKLPLWDTLQVHRKINHERLSISGSKLSATNFQHG